MRAWVRLQNIYDFKAEITETRGLMELFESDLPRYKSVGHSIVEAERIWHNAVAEFQYARRRDHGRNAGLLKPITCADSSWVQGVPPSVHSREPYHRPTRANAHSVSKPDNDR